MFESALEAGLSAAGVDIMLLGPMPTPGVAYLTRTFRAQAGIVISASHNPYQDNGIKFFSGEGRKLNDDIEKRIEDLIDTPMTIAPSIELGKAHRVSDAEGRYIEFCNSTFGVGASLNGIKIVVDCANGATYNIAPDVFSELGADVVTIGASPNGLNINQDCGATSTDNLQAAVLSQGADIGIALDGDGDRLIMVDHHGEVVDGDELLFVIARERQRTRGMNGAIVGTLMSNLGLEHAVKTLGLDFKRANVGDRHIMEMLQENDWTLGGESSGHLICLDMTTTGDGIVSALQVLDAMVRSGQSLNTLKSGMVKYPQCLVNVTLDQHMDVMSLESVKAAVSEVEEELSVNGRVLLRPSGTEPLIRVMVEGRDGGQVVKLANQLADAVRGAMAAAVA
jgi:phosphoglucosamine mutase